MHVFRKVGLCRLLHQGRCFRQLQRQSQVSVNLALSDFTEKTPLALPNLSAGVPYNETKLICTIGPTCESSDMIEQLIVAGMDVARLNFSHECHEVQQKRLEMVRAAASKLGVFEQVGVALDTKGPEIRCGVFHDKQPVEFLPGEKVHVTCNEKYAQCSTRDILYIGYKRLNEDLAANSRILIADGTLELVVEGRSTDTELAGWICKVLVPTTISGRNNVHFQGIEVDLPVVSPSDISDLEFGVEIGVDMVFASFVSSLDHVLQIRQILDNAPGAKKRSLPVPIIAKIESYGGLKYLKDIVKAADGIMVARGDLGVELVTERLFLAQKHIISMCNVAAKPCIVATQMLDSMTRSPRPTRAEASDVANAVIDGADCVMLSGETANGKYPVRSVEMLRRIAAQGQQYIRKYNRFMDLLDYATAQIQASNPHERTFDNDTFHSETVASSAVLAAFQLNAACIITTTALGGRSIRMLSKFSPPCPILAICRSVDAVRRLSLVRDTVPLYYEEYSDKHFTMEEWMKRFDEIVAHALKDPATVRMLLKHYEVQTSPINKQGVPIVVTNTDLRGPFRGSVTIRYLQH